ncbi:MAG: zinc ABC transporter solute-binding protein [Thermoplasmata archaeon]|nr:zinc ABC transporter solute-binding protein [Thermoplasmata archaeon]
MTNMRTYKIGTIALVAVLLATALAVPGWVAADEDELSIVCSNSLLADFTSNVVGDLARVEYLMPSGVCPSHYDSRPSDAVMVAGADIIVMMGWEGWLNGLIVSTGNDDAVLVKCMGLGEQNLPTDVKDFVDRIATDLAVAMEEDAATISANAVAYKEEIDAKAAELVARVEAADATGRTVVVMTWQKAFVEWLGFEVEFSFGPPEEMSVGDQLEVTSAASEDAVVLMVDNLQSGAEFGALVASETGVTHVVLTNFPDATPNVNTYLEMIEYNTEQLIKGVETYDYKKGEIASLEEQVDDLQVQNMIFLSLALIFILCTVFLAVVLIRSRSRGE